MAGEYLKSSVHVHSKLCDGKNTPEEVAVTAWKAGLQTLGFSGHSHTPHDPCSLVHLPRNISPV